MEYQVNYLLRRKHWRNWTLTWALVSTLLSLPFQLFGLLIGVGIPHFICLLILCQKDRYLQRKHLVWYLLLLVYYSALFLLWLQMTFRAQVHTFWNSNEVYHWMFLALGPMLFIHLFNLIYRLRYAAFSKNSKLPFRHDAGGGRSSSPTDQKQITP